jgi:hypothetical protein
VPNIIIVSPDLDIGSGVGLPSIVNSDFISLKSFYFSNHSLGV